MGASLMPVSSQRGKESRAQRTSTMQFLKKFWRELRKSDSADAVAAPEQEAEKSSDIGPDERLGRFVFHKKDVSRESGLPKQKVFLPEKHPETGVFETSVCRMD